jgi:hypothetical protein
MTQSTTAGCQNGAEKLAGATGRNVPERSPQRAQLAQSISDIPPYRCTTSATADRGGRTACADHGRIMKRTGNIGAGSGIRVGLGSFPELAFSSAYVGFGPDNRHWTACSVMSDGRREPEIRRAY